MSRFLLSTALLALSVCLVGATAVNARPTYSTNVGGNIPDSNAGGISSTITVADTGVIDGFSGITIHGLSHTWAGDLVITLTHGSTTVDIIDRLPLIVGGGIIGTENSNFSGDYTFVDSGGADIVAVGEGLGDNGIIPAGMYNAVPVGMTITFGGTSPANGQLSDFFGSDLSGDWVLNIADREDPDTGSFAGWSFTATTPSVAVVPEANTFALALPALAMVGTIVIRKRKMV